MMRAATAIGIAVFLIVGCAAPTLFTGHVSDAATGESMVGVRVLAVKCNGSWNTGILRPWYDDLTSTRTDERGNFQLLLDTNRADAVVAFGTNGWSWGWIWAASFAPWRTAEADLRVEKHMASFSTALEAMWRERRRKPPNQAVEGTVR